jgi:uncharacterized protein involved in cysteine biosynthesis
MASHARIRLSHTRVIYYLQTDRGTTLKYIPELLGILMRTLDIVVAVVFVDRWQFLVINMVNGIPCTLKAIPEICRWLALVYWLVMIRVVLTLEYILPQSTERQEVRTSHILWHSTTGACRHQSGLFQ